MYPNTNYFILGSIYNNKNYIKNSYNINSYPNGTKILTGKMTLDSKQQKPRELEFECQVKFHT